MAFSSSVSDDEMRQLSRGDKSSVLKICQKNGLALRHAPERWRSQREVVCVAVADNYRALEFASQTMKDTEEVVRTAVITDGWAFRFASKRLRRDRALPWNVAVGKLLSLVWAPLARYITGCR